MSCCPSKPKPVLTATADGGGPYTVAVVAMGGSRDEYIRECVAGSGRFSVADETWAVNAMGGIIDSDRAIIMDDLRYFAKASREAPHLRGYANWLHLHPCIITSTAHEEFPNSVAFPIKEVVNVLGYAYFNNTTAYAVALAVYLRVRHLKLYGMDFTADGRDAKLEAGRACVEFWLGRATLQGMKVTIAKTSTLCDQSIGRRLYGYSVPPF